LQMILILILTSQPHVTRRAMDSNIREEHERCMVITTSLTDRVSVRIEMANMATVCV
jgi:hypothetical protein